jgi:hypothetical protein
MVLGRFLPDYFRRTVTPSEAVEMMSRSLELRGENFLELARTQIYNRPESPYLRLLALAGCGFADLETQVRRHGLETTLERLAEAGVYVTSDEFKGKKDIVRGGRSFRVSPEAFDALEPRAGFLIQSSGTTNAPVRSFIPIDWIARESLMTSAAFAAHDLFGSAHAVYDSILPGAGGFFALLMYSRAGVPIDHWFARKIPSHGWAASASSYATSYLIVFMGKRFGRSFPAPDFLDVSEVRRIAEWAARMRRQGAACCVTTAASNAARIAREAFDAGISLDGVRFIATGEPLTEAKQEIIRKVGADVIPRYVYGGCLLIGYGCAAPEFIDDIHVDLSTVALIANPRPIPANGPAVRALLCTTVAPGTSRLLLNTDNGDYAEFSTRRCGCALEKLGLGLHLYRIRSYEKFTSEGMNYFYGDLFETFEKALPAEFGGGPGDYQLVEEEDAGGQTRLTCVVHPRLEGLDEQKLLQRLQQALGQGSFGNQFQANIWRAAGTMRVERREPHASGRGKILPLHMRH